MVQRGVSEDWRRNRREGLSLSLALLKGESRLTIEPPYVGLAARCRPNPCARELSPGCYVKYRWLASSHRNHRIHFRHDGHEAIGDRR